MPLKDTSVRICRTGGSDTRGLEIIHRPTGEILQTLSVQSPTESHRSFIISTWLKSYKPMVKRMVGMSHLYDIHEPKIAESRWKDCLILTDEDGHTVYAWCCGYPGALYHCYVIPELRGIGVARSLIKEACGERPYAARPWPFKHMPLNPYLLGAADADREEAR